MNESALPSGHGEHTPRHSFLGRSMGAVLTGFIVGLFLWAGLSTGLRYHFLEEQQSTPWGIFFWGEHWALRVAASCVATIGVGYVAGIISRRRGQVVAVISALPATLIWLGIAVLAWRGRFSLMDQDYDFHVSIGNRLAASLLVFAILPIAAWAGKAGQDDGELYGEHFDGRRSSLLGIKWYHFIWLPFVAYLWLVQLSWAVFYGLGWLKIMWKSEISLLSIVPAIFTIMIWGTLAIMGNGAAKTYTVLAGFESIPTKGGRALAVLKYAFGAFLLAAILQTGIQLLLYGLAKLLGLVGHAAPAP